MLYRDIVKRLAKSRNMRFAELAEKVGASSQARLSARLGESWNPGMRDAQEMFGVLGYKVVLVPEGTRLAEDWFEPEFPDRPAKRGGE